MLDPKRCHRLLVFGGAFDPPHRSHVELPFEAAAQAGADGVLFVPTGSPPHKGPTEAGPDDRLAMLRLALGQREDAAISTIELQRPGPSYMVRTLEHLREQLGPDPELRLLIGSDMAASFYKWRWPRRIIELAEPLVMMRPPHDAGSMLAELPDELSDAERRAWRRRIVCVGEVDAASTDLRRLLREGRYDDPAVTRLLAPAVLRYIRDHDLYRGQAG